MTASTSCPSFLKTDKYLFYGPFSAFGSQHNKSILPKTPKKEPMPETFQQCLHSRHISKISEASSCRCSSFGKKGTRKRAMPAPSPSPGLRLHPAYLSSKNTFDWTHGIRLGSVHNNKKTRKMFHVSSRQSTTSTSKLQGAHYMSFSSAEPQTLLRRRCA